MTKEQILNNYIDYILSNLTKVVRGPYIDYDWGKRNYFWYGSFDEPILMPGITEDINNMFEEITWDNYWTSFLREKIKYSIPKNNSND